MNFRYLIFYLLMLVFIHYGYSSTPVDTNIITPKSLIEKVEKLNDLAYKTLVSDPKTSLKYSGLSVTLSKQAGYTTGQISGLILTGMVYKNIGAYDKAMTSYFNAMRIAKETNDQVRVSSCLNNIGSVFQIQSNYSKALYYYKLSMDIEEKLGNKEQLSIRLYNMGVVYEAMDSLNMAYTYYYNSLLIEEKSGNKEGIYYALYGIAGIDTKMGRYQNAMDNLKRAMSIAHELKDILGISVCHSETGKLFMARGLYKEAVVSFDSSVIYARQGNLLNEMKDAYFSLSAAYNKLGENVKAYDNLIRYVEINDSLNNMGIRNRVAEIETRYEVEQKEKEIAYLKEMGRLKSENADSQKRNRNFLLVTVVLAMLLAVINLKKIAVNSRKAILLALGIFVFLCLISLAIRVFGHDPEGFTFVSYSRTFADVLTYSVLPIFMFILLAERFLLKRYLKKASDLTEQIKTLNLPDKEQKIELQFDGKEGKMAINLSDLICCESNDNYTAIYYVKNGDVKKELKRITLKRIEDQLAGINEIVRCHKSFIINVLNVSHVSGNAQGYKFHLHKLDFAIPVSRNFPQSMINTIKSKV